ncbi:MAG: SUMF1/EgtB/PvdO family nonheme iron enzyme [Polyangiaceae bacterium]|nr:SUMF1/EgtB/PvdO family nonheme iron enzyme [Polyangiaceae bacterium]
MLRRSLLWIAPFLCSLGACVVELDPPNEGGSEVGGYAGSMNQGTGGGESPGGFGEGGFGGVGGSGGSGLMGDPCEVNGELGVCADVSECTLEGWAPTPGFCPGPANIQCCAPIPRGECNPDAAPFPNAEIEEAPGTGGCPAGMLRIEDFCIDRFEAFLVTYPDDGPVSPFFNPGDAPVTAKSAVGAVPQGYINQWQAGDACLNAGKRLCADDEWLRACGGPSAYTYPYGDQLVLGTCNDHRDQHPAIEYFMTSDDWIWSELGHPCLNQLPESLATTGAFADCETEEGAFDMMGNLHEWTDDPAGTFRGGFYVDTSLNGPGCLYATTAHDVSHWDYSTGFRCCADP